MRATILVAIVLAFSVSHASAVSLAVKLACADDYFAHCSMHAPDSPGVRACMRSVGRNLSQRCIGALRDAGEIKQTRVASAKIHVPKRTVARASTAKRLAAAKPALKKTYASTSSKRKVYASKANARKKHYASRHDTRKYASKDAARTHEAADRKSARRDHVYEVARN